jgi:CDP-diglyceride synthetase
MKNLLSNNKSQKSIAMLLMVTVLALLVLPIHIHLHHEHGMHGHHEHVVDYHMVLDGNDDVEHINHADAHVIETSSDFITKQSSDNLFKLAAVVVLFLIMSLQFFSYFQRRYQPVRLNYQKYYSLSPPLRAPPL